MDAPQSYERKRRRDSNDSTEERETRRKRDEQQDYAQYEKFPANHLLSELQGRLLDDDTFKDLLITCRGRKWKVHRSVVSQRCSFFKACCTRDCKEAGDRRIDLSEDDPEAVGAMIYYLYTLDYCKGRRDDYIDKLEREVNRGTGVASSKDDLRVVMKAEWTWDVEVWRIADKYNLLGLMARARQHILEIRNRNEDLPHLMAGFVFLVDALCSLGSSRVAARLRTAALGRFFDLSYSASCVQEFRDLISRNSEFAHDYTQILGDFIKENVLNKKPRCCSGCGKRIQLHRWAQSGRSAGTGSTDWTD